LLPDDGDELPALLAELIPASGVGRPLPAPLLDPNLIPRDDLGLIQREIRLKVSLADHLNADTATLESGLRNRNVLPAGSDLSGHGIEAHGVGGGGVTSPAALRIGWSQGGMETAP
jgi:hypothetical protein